MNKRSPSARAARPSTRRQVLVARARTGPRGAAVAPLTVATLVALGACGADAPSSPERQGASVAPSGPTDGADPSIDLSSGGTPFNDGYLTFDQALVLAATGQSVELPGLGAAEPPQTGAEPTAPPPDPGVEVPGTGVGAGTDTGTDTGTGGGSTDGGDGSVAPPATGGTDGGEDTTGGAGPGPQTPTAGSPSTEDVGDSTLGRTFTATTTEGFTGEVLEDGSVRVTWPTDRSARGYNTYRDAEYVTTVFDTEWVDEDTHDGDFYYEIEAFDIADNFTRIAKGLTVPVRGSGRTDPEPDRRGTPQLEGFELVFSEEFEGDSLDLDTWNTSYLWGDDLVINQEEQHYVDVANEPDFGYDPFEVADGTLTISAVPTPPELADRANGQPYLSGVITSYDAFKFTYGYVETRARVPFGQGLWPAFWLLNAYYGDDDPEIDIMEFIGDDQDVVYHTYHYYDGDELRSTESKPVPGVDYTNGFHTFAVDWSPGLLIFYVDGRETHRVVDPRVSDQEMYIIANTALGGWWPGSPDETTEFPADYEIDYIRVYRQSEPYGDPPFADGTPSSVPSNEAVPGTSPNHRPPLELFPNGYPTRP